MAAGEEMTIGEKHGWRKLMALMKTA